MIPQFLNNTISAISHLLVLFYSEKIVTETECNKLEVSSDWYQQQQRTAAADTAGQAATAGILLATVIHPQKSKINCAQ